MHRNPMNGYRLFQGSDLENLLITIEASGKSKNSGKRRKLK